MKTVKSLVYIAFLILASIFLVSCGKQTINGVALPEFYGLFAIDGGKLIQIKQGDFPNLSENVTFLLFDKSVAFGADATFYSIGFDTEPHPADDGSFSWPKFIQQGDDYQRASEAALTGIPLGASPIETLKKPVPNKNEMLQFAPAAPLKPGIYQLGNVAKFWVDKEKYQATVESNARQALQAEHWVDASRFATIALIVGLSQPNQAEEFTQIKFGALSKGARKAIDQGNFDIAQNLAQRGNDLQPPYQYTTEFRQLLSIEIPYGKAIKVALNAAKLENWDAVMQAGSIAARLKPADPKAKEILLACPKIPLLAGEPFPNPVEQVKTYKLHFTADGEKFCAVVQGIGNNGYPYPPTAYAWDVDARSVIKKRDDFPILSFCFSPKDDVIAWGSLKLDNFFAPSKPREVFGTYPFQPEVDDYGFNETGSMVWTIIHGFTERNMASLGLLATANELGLMDTLLQKSVILWDTETLKPITVVGFPTSGHPKNIKSAIANDQVVVLLEGFTPDWGGPALPLRLSAWDIQTHKLLASVNESGQDLSIWGFAPDDKRVIIWLNGKFWLWNWETKHYESPVELATQGNHITAFSPNRKYFADRSTSDPCIRVCEFETGKVLCKFKEASGVSVTGMAFSPDGSYLAVSLDRITDFLALWKIPEDLKPLIAEKLVFAAEMPKAEPAATIPNSANQQDSDSKTNRSAVTAQSGAVVVKQAPPPVLAETPVAAPGPGYIWQTGEWQWKDGWVWVAGRWAYPPHPQAVWVRGSWYQGSQGWLFVAGHWR